MQLGSKKHPDINVPAQLGQAQFVSWWIITAGKPNRLYLMFGFPCHDGRLSGPYDPGSLGPAALSQADERIPWISWTKKRCYRELIEEMLALAMNMN